MSAFKAKEVVRILKELGFIEKRKTGSHLILHSAKLNKIIPVPIHAKDWKKAC